MTEPTRTWPEGFLWGTAASALQAEGAPPASDWADWEAAGQAPPSGEGNGFARRHREDFRAYASLGLDHHRISIEWSRLEPEPGRHDPEAVAYYREVLSAAHEEGIHPWVCLLHFAAPRWFAADGDFLSERNRDEVWPRHVEFVAETFGDLVEGWQPVNETNYYAGAKFRGGGWPPGHDDRDKWATCTRNIHLASADAARRLRQTGVPVTSIFGLSPVIAQDDAPETATRVARELGIHWDTGLGLFRDGILRVPGLDPVERPDLAGAYDLIGFSYYAAMGVKAGKIALQPPDAPISPLGYGIWADGVGAVLDRLHQEVPGTPLLVAEYGIGTDDDTERVAYLERGLEVVGDAIDRGVDVRGFFHWTGVDNYEWLHGYDVRFGIIDRDRTVRPSAQVLAREALGRFG